MKNKVVCFIILFLTIIVSMFLFENISYAGYQDMKRLEYDVTLKEDGSADIIETWNIYVEDTNTLARSFNMDGEKFSNVKVEELSIAGDVANEFIDTKEYAYHVDKNSFYALEIDEGKFEIAWGVSIDYGENRIYRLSYTVNDAVKTYNDCSEFYWMFLDSSNSIAVDNVLGTIRLPKKVSKKENLKVWAHGPLNGEITIEDTDLVLFQVNNLGRREMLETRIAVTEDIFPLNVNKVYSNKLGDIIAEETKWADDANRERERIQKEEEMFELLFKVFFIGFIIICCITVFIFVIIIIKYIKILLKTNKMKPEEEFIYYRDLPDSNKTPAEAAFLYYFDEKGAFTNNASKILSATILDLALKKAISFEEENNEIYIKINENYDITTLKSDELSIYYLLDNVKKYIIGKNGDSIYRISMKDIEKYAKKNDTKFLSKIEGLERIAQGYNIADGNFEEETKNKAKKWSTKGFWYFMSAFICVCFIIPFVAVIPCLICGVLCKLIAKKTRNLTQKGVNEQAEWKGLKKYMDDFSMIDEREVPELAIWEKYLIYATAFGIADKVIKQLKVKYPEFTDEELMMNGYAYLYMMNRINFDRAVTSSIQRAYTSSMSERAARNAASSIGSWSSGGGRRRRIFWRWRPVVGGRRWHGPEDKNFHIQ